MSEGTPFRTTEGGRHCPICEHVADPGASFAEYRLFRCRHCGCWSSDALFRGAATSFESRNYFANADLDQPKWAALMRRLEAEGNPLRSVLDVGCGNGAFLSFVAKDRPDVRCEGIEIDHTRAAQAREGNPQALIHEGDACDALAAASDSFDLITLWDVFEHVPNPVQLLSRLSQQLAPGGVIHLVTIHEQSLLPMLGRFSHWISGGRLTYPMRRTHDAHHLCFFTRKGLDIAVEACGLEIRDLSFDRLRRRRMDGPAFVTAATAALLSLENALGNGLFINLTLGSGGRSGRTRSERAWS